MFKHPLVVEYVEGVRRISRPDEVDDHMLVTGYRDHVDSIREWPRP